MSERLTKINVESTKPTYSKLALDYDQTYKESPATFGGGRAESFVRDAAGLTPMNGRVLELGAGQGRNALTLAEMGLQVTAIDISQVGVDFMNAKAQELGLTHFRAEVKDASENIEGEFDMIVSTYMLHHLSKENALKLVAKIKERTKSGGLNVIATFTAEGDFAQSPNAVNMFYPNLGEMQKLYRDWEIITYSEDNSRALDTKTDGSPMTNIAVRIIARKII